VPQAPAPRQVGVPAPLIWTGSNVSVTEGTGGSEEDRAAAVNRAARLLTAAERKARQRKKEREQKMAAPPPERCVISADGGHIRGNTTPSDSVHMPGSAIVTDIVPRNYYRLHEWEAWKQEGGRLELLFGKHLWTRRTRRRPSVALSSSCLSRKGKGLPPTARDGWRTW